MNHLETAVFEFNKQFDTTLIPILPFAESDRMETRVQVKNVGKNGYIFD